MGAASKPAGELLVRLASSAPTPVAALPMARKSTAPMRVEWILRGGESGKAALGPLLWLTIGLLAGVGLTLGVTSLLKPKDENQINVITQSFLVPPDFLTHRERPEAADPFASVTAGALPKRRTAREVLEEVGIAFPAGSSAIYNPATSTLIVRNEAPQMDLVEAYAASLVANVQKQIYITTKTVEIIAGSEDFAMFENQSGAPELAGVFTDPQFQVLIRALSQRKGVDLLSAPSVLARSGQRAYVEVSGERVLDVTAVIGLDGYTIDLQLHRSPADNDISTSVTIWDGQTVAWTEPLPGGKLKVSFVTASLIDPAGMPFSPPKNADGTEKRP